MNAALRYNPLILALLVGLILRVVAVGSGFGYFAADDYSSVIEPAAAWVDAPDAPVLWDIRSALFPRVFSWLLASGQAVGLSDPAALLQWSYGWLGLWSLLSIVGVYFLAAPRFGATAAVVAAWLVAAHPLMPRICTRALIEVVCMPPLVWGLVALARGRRLARARNVSATLTYAGMGGLLLGLAAMLRYQVGVIYVAVWLGLGWLTLRGKEQAERRAMALAWAGLNLGGLVALALQGWIDHAFHGAPFASLWRYFTFNMAHSAEVYGVTGAWYTYAGVFVLLTVPPATLGLWRPLWRACRTDLWLSLPFALFIATHSVIAHREERFMFPVFPLFLVLVATALVWAWQGTRWQRVAVGFFAACNALVLPFATLSDSQRSATVPLLEVARSENPPGTVHWVAKREPPRFYTGGRAELVWTRKPSKLAETLAQVPKERSRFVLSDAPTPETYGALHGAGLRCHGPRQFPGDFLDRIVAHVNPRHNKRRMPMFVLDCQPQG